MHIRVTPGSMQPDKVQEALAVIGEMFAAYRQGEGFQHGYAAVDEQSGEGMVVTLWDSEQAAQAASQQARQLLTKLAPLMVSGQTPTIPRAYKVQLES